MENNDKAIQELFSRLEQLSRQQRDFQDEIRKLHQELQQLRSAESRRPAVSEPVLRPPQAPPPVTELKRATAPPPPPTRRKRIPWEDFVGTNLLNKVGIAVLVIGIGFGAKYAIDHELLNALTRTILGYLSGIALIGIAFRLKPNHPGFSAVLLSGGMAVLYFITYIAYSYFQLIPQEMAFILMVLFTFFTVLASLQYNLEVVGVIGLVGAYAVPILLSDGSGRVLILFSYMTIINAGILVLAFKKYWKRLYYLAFILTWLAFGSWYAFSFNADDHISISLIFSTVFFLIFYATFLSYKLIRREALGRWDVVFMLLNSFIYFGFGYFTVDALEGGEQYLGLFTLFTALIHFVACVILYKKQDSFTDIFYFVAGMVLVFLTIAVPVQLEGNWVTLVWAGEAALLFWIGRTKLFPTYEKIAYALIALAFLSLLHDWSNAYPGFYYYTYNDDTTFTIFLNVQFLTSMFVASMFAFTLWVTRRYPDGKALRPGSGIHTIISAGIPLLALVVCYVGFYKEIEAFWNYHYAASRVVVRSDDGVEYDQYNNGLVNFKRIWLLLYSAFFATALCLLQRKLTTRQLTLACLAINFIVLLIFVSGGLLDLRALRSAFIEQEMVEYYHRGYWHVLIRYLVVLAMLPLLWFNRRLCRHDGFREDTRRAERIFFHFVVLAVLSSELIHWLDIARVENTFKLSLSILWGMYALYLIVLGLSRDQKHIRVAAIVLFATTLIKLFAYDMADMSTILKTIVMIVLGALLLTASFIYNKYKRSAENETR